MSDIEPHWRAVCREFAFERASVEVRRALSLAPDEPIPFNDRWEHVQRVVQVAVWLADKCGADRDIVEAAAWLHDIRKSEPNHGKAGAAEAEQILRKTDFPAEKIAVVVDAIARHVGLTRAVGAAPLAPVECAVLWDADKLTKRDAAGDITNLGMKLTTWFWEHLTWICSFGGRIWDVEKNEPTPDHPGVIAALEDLAAAAKRYGIDQLDRWSASIGGQEGVQQPFMTGHLSMMIDGDWYLQQIDEMKKEWTPGVDFGVDVAPYAP